MMPAAPLRIQSRDNALFKDFKRLAQDSGAWRRQGRVWAEGDHLCRAALTRGWRPELAVFSESFWPLAPAEFAQVAIKNVVMTDALMAAVSGLPSPAPLAFVLELPAAPALLPDAPTVVLDRVQDAGNVGSILRSASALGFRQVLAIKGTAALWGSKVVRAGMGAHFALALHEQLDVEAVTPLRVPMFATSSHQGDHVHAKAWPWPCAWVMGHEGQGVGEALMARADGFARIIQPGGEESLNVAAAAAICLHASAASAQAR